jgi:hypothetical protein
MQVLKFEHLPNISGPTHDDQISYFHNWCFKIDAAFFQIGNLKMEIYSPQWGDVSKFMSDKTL